WSRLGHADSLAYEDYPRADPAHLVDDTVTCVVQVKGKVRGRVEVSPEVGDDELQEIALAEPNVAKYVEGLVVRKVTVRAPNLVHLVSCPLRGPDVRHATRRRVAPERRAHGGGVAAI